MRWFSGFAILFYLSLLCTPQVFAVHEAKVSPLADSQLQAVQPALQLQLQNQATDNEEPPTAALIAAQQQFNVGNSLCISSVSQHLAPCNSGKVWQARAPPFPLSF